MSFKPSIVALDYETALLDGTPSVEYYRPDFRVTSAAAAWVGEDGAVKTRYMEGEDDVRLFIQRIQAGRIPLVVHNFQFEFGVTAHRFNGLESTISIDTMRLVQVGDNGGKDAQRDFRPRISDEDDTDDEASPAVKGLGLQASASRWLGSELQNHKEPAYAYLRSLGVKAGAEGKNLDKLTPELMRSYNVADAVVTLKLYQRLTEEFAKIGYDWTLDHSLYTASAKRIALAKGRGIKVDRDALQSYRDKVIAEIAQIEGAFRSEFEDPIAEIESEYAETYVKALKTERGQAQRRKQVEDGTADIRFNVGSNQQLARLLVDKLGITPKFYTEESKQSKNRRKENPDLPPFIPSPSMKAAHLATYGKPGEMLIQRRKRMLVLKQVGSLLELSELDGRWHADLRAAGTSTGRFSGGSHGR
jgi:hypothetical protein